MQLSKLCKQLQITWYFITVLIRVETTAKKLRGGGKPPNIWTCCTSVLWSFFERARVYRELRSFQVIIFSPPSFRFARKKSIPASKAKTDNKTKKNVFLTWSWSGQQIWLHLPTWRTQQTNYCSSSFVAKILSLSLSLNLSQPFLKKLKATQRVREKDLQKMKKIYNFFTSYCNRRPQVTPSFLWLRQKHGFKLFSNKKSFFGRKGVKKW